MKAWSSMAVLLLACMSAGCGSRAPLVKNSNIASPVPISTQMNTPNGKTPTENFLKNLPADFETPADDVGKRLLKEYGALFVARGVVVPKVVVFKHASAVNAFQSSAKSASDTIGGTTVELQEPALQALKEAIADAATSGLTITPRGADAAKRSYDDTVALWASRVGAGLDHWTAAGRISTDVAKHIRSLSPYDQVPEIFKLEDQGIFFSKDLSKSIIYSVAPPGASQHLSMLAFDVSEYDNSTVREILARHGWFQTVVSDLPHFTYLGAVETDLPRLGLKKVMAGDRVFWVPDL
jgi:LAS superfamily LD-carboxypeptidase LdcB